jgi:hypothetical protein
MGGKGSRLRVEMRKPYNIGWLGDVRLNRPNSFGGFRTQVQRSGSGQGPETQSHMLIYHFCCLSTAVAIGDVEIEDTDAKSADRAYNVAPPQIGLVIWYGISRL